MEQNYKKLSELSQHLEIIQVLTKTLSNLIESMDAENDFDKRKDHFRAAVLKRSKNFSPSAVRRPP